MISISVPHIVELVEVIRSMDDRVASVVVASSLVLIRSHLVETRVIASVVAISASATVSCDVIVRTGNCAKRAMMGTETYLGSSGVVGSTPAA